MVVLPQKVKHRVTTYPIKPTIMYITKRNENVWLHKTLYINAHHSVNHKCPRVGNNPNVCQLKNGYI